MLTIFDLGKYLNIYKRQTKPKKRNALFLSLNFTSHSHYLFTLHCVSGH